MRNKFRWLRGKRLAGGDHSNARAAQLAAARRAGRRGAAAAELALVLPVFIALIVGMFEFSRAFMLKQAVTAAAQEACRVAILDGSTSTSVRSKAVASLSPAGIGSSSVTVTTTPTAPSSGGYDTPVSVTVAVPYSAVSSTAAWFLPANSNLTATVTMRRETVK
jgi:Flp pilus assembly protein TadG